MTQDAAPIGVPSPEKQPLLDVWPDAGRLLGMRRTVAYRLVREGKFPIEVIRIGGRVKVRTVDVRRFVGLDPEPDLVDAS